MRKMFEASGYSDDCAAMSGLDGLSEYDVGGRWFPFIVDGKRIGVCGLFYEDDGCWHFRIKPGPDHTVEVLEE